MKWKLSNHVDHHFSFLFHTHPGPASPQGGKTAWAEGVYPALPSSLAPLLKGTQKKLKFQQAPDSNTFLVQQVVAEYQIIQDSVDHLGEDYLKQFNL